MEPELLHYIDSTCNLWRGKKPKTIVTTSHGKASLFVFVIKFKLDWLVDFFLFQFYVPFKIISAHTCMRRAKSRWGENRRTPRKTTSTPASRTWLVSNAARAGLEPTPDTAVR